MVDDERVGRLLGMQLQLLGQRHADLFGPQQLDNLRPVFEIGTRRVPKE